MQAYGTYAAIWRAEFGWSTTALALAFSLQRVESGLLGPIQGWLLERYGVRRIIRVGVILLGAGFIFLSRINSLTAFYLAFLVMAFGASLMGILSLMSVLVKWFEKKRATALAFMQTGMSLGGLAAPIVAWALLGFGWRQVAFASGVIILLVGWLISYVMLDDPERYGMRPDGAPVERHQDRKAERNTPAPPKATSFTTKQALQTRSFWFLSLGHALAVMLVSSVLAHLVVHLNEGLDYTIPQAASIFALMTAFTIVGQLLGGLVGDRVDKRLMATGAMFGHATAMLALAYATSFIGVLYFAVAHGLAWGIRGPVMGALRADYFGTGSFPTIMGVSSMVVKFGAMGGPLIAGIFADAFGDYQLGFTVLAVLAASGSVFFFFATKPKL